MNLLAFRSYSSWKGFQLFLDVFDDGTARVMLWTMTVRHKTSV